MLTMLWSSLALPWYDSLLHYHGMLLSCLTMVWFSLVLPWYDSLLHYHGMILSCITMVCFSVVLPCYNLLLCYHARIYYSFVESSFHHHVVISILSNLWGPRTYGFPTSFQWLLWCRHHWWADRPFCRIVGLPSITLETALFKIG